MPLLPEHCEHLVAALLTVNGYPLDRAVALMPAFRKAGLLDANRVAALDYEALVAALNAAGYTRGGFVPIVGYRVAQALSAAASGQLDALARQAEGGDKEGFSTTLAAVHGFGPRTAATAWFLWTGR